jgi:hypothetical protein
MARASVERQLDECRQAGAQMPGREQRDLAFDHPGLPQALDATQAGRRRGVDPFRQGLVGQRRVRLQVVEDAEVRRVEGDGDRRFH